MVSLRIIRQDEFQLPEWKIYYLRTSNAYIRAVKFYDGMTDLIVKSGVKEALADHPVSADFPEALNEEVGELLNEAAERAEANGRKTVQPQDL